MIRSLWIAILLIMSQQGSWAQESIDQNSKSLMDHYSAEFIEIINQAQLEKNTNYMLGDTSVADACVAFMNKNQLVGKVGAAVYSELAQNTKLYPHLLQGGSVSKYCRKYPEMSTQQKALVWVFIMTTMAHFESSCSETAKAKGPNGVAYGYFQLHKGKENFYAQESKACVKNASTNPILSSKCAMGMLEKQMYNSNGQLFSRKSYWEVLRPQGHADKARIIAKALSRSSFCNPQVM